MIALRRIRMLAIIGVMVLGVTYMSGWPFALLATCILAIRTCDLMLHERGDMS